jgi:hypothetical protein
MSQTATTSDGNSVVLAKYTINITYKVSNPGEKNTKEKTWNVSNLEIKETISQELRSFSLFTLLLLMSRRLNERGHNGEGFLVRTRETRKR